MKKFPNCDTIKIENSRAICPICGGKLPGEFLPDSAVSGYIIQCKSCRKRIRIEYRSDPRPSVQRPVVSTRVEAAGRFLFCLCLEVIAQGNEERGGRTRRESGVTSILRQQNLGAGGIHFRRAGEIQRGFPKILWIFGRR